MYDVIKIDDVTSVKYRLHKTMQRLGLAESPYTITVDGTTFMHSGTYTLTYSDGIKTTVQLIGDDNDK